MVDAHGLRSGFVRQREGHLRRFGQHEIAHTDHRQPAEAAREGLGLALVEFRTVPRCPNAVVGLGQREPFDALDTGQGAFGAQQRLVEPVGLRNARFVVGERDGEDVVVASVTRMRLAVARRGAEIEVRLGVIAHLQGDVTLVVVLGDLETLRSGRLAGHRPAARRLAQTLEYALHLRGVRRQAFGQLPSVFDLLEVDRALVVGDGQGIDHPGIETQERLRLGHGTTPGRQQRPDQHDLHGERETERGLVENLRVAHDEIPNCAA